MGLDKYVFYFMSSVKIQKKISILLVKSLAKGCSNERC